MMRPVSLLPILSSCLVVACGEAAQDPAAQDDMSTGVVRDAPDATYAPQRGDMPPDASDLGSSVTCCDVGASPQGDDMELDMDSSITDQDAGTQDPPPARCQPGEERCVDAFPARLTGSTTTSTQSRYDRYACAPDTDEGGPELLYRLLLDEPGFLAARLEDLPAGVDVDLHLLLDGQDPDSCLDRGHFSSGAYLEPGEYWLVVDSWVNASGESLDGAFALTMHLNTVESLERHGLSRAIAEDALVAFASAWSAEHSRRLEYSITDFSIHSSNPRAWVLDLATDARLFHTTIGHGIGSIEGDDRGVSSLFSNVPQSYTSSLGMMRAAETYVGDFGYSMRLDGLEPGFNDNVRSRDIVVHPDDRNRPEVTQQQGYLTPSRGCPTLEPDLSRQLIDTVRDGSLMFYWYPDMTWRNGSIFLN